MGNKLINLLRLIFKEDLTATEKTERLIRDYDLQLTEEMGEELNIMCNLSEGIEERGIARGIARGRAEGKAEGRAEGRAEATEKIVRNLLAAKDMTYERIAQVTDISVADVARIADK